MSGLLERIDSRVAAMDGSAKPRNAHIHVYEETQRVLEEADAIRDTDALLEDLWKDAPSYPLTAWGFDEPTGTLTLVGAAYLGDAGAKAVNDCVQLRKLSLAFFGADPKEVKRAVVTKGMVDAARVIAGHVKEGRIRQVRHELLLDRLPEAVEPESKASISGIEHHFRYWSAEDADRLDRRGSSWMEIVVRFPEGERPKALEVGSANGKVLLVAINGKTLAGLYERHRGRILELNVRSFLQTRGKVNKDILKSLKESPDSFLALNNGISAVACGATLKDGAISELRGFQIVNGGQTTAVIHAACYGKRMDVSNVWVQAKVTVLDGGDIEELASQIARCANTQNRISAADLSTNSAFLKEFERICNVPPAGGDPGCYFERSRGGWQTHLNTLKPQEARLFQKQFPKADIFDKTELAKWLNAWSRHPHIASLGSQKNFVHFIEAVTQAGAAPDEAYVRNALGVGRIWRAALEEAKGSGVEDNRPQVAAYLLALLSSRAIGLDLGAGGVSDGVRTFLTDYALDVSRVLTEIGGGRIFGEVCKKAETWRQISERPEWNLNTALKREVTANAPVPDFKNKMVSQDGIMLIRQMMDIPEVDWTRALEWAKLAPGMSARDRSMILSCVGIAMEKKTPSEAQASYALSIMTKFRAAQSGDMEAEESD